MLDDLERLERAATPAPIGIDRDGEIFPLNAAGEFVIEGEIAAMVSDNPNDGPLFVQGRNALPALLRVARAAGEAIAESDEQLADAARDGETNAYCSMLYSLRAALAALEGHGDA